MTTRGAWIVLVLLLAVQATARGDFIATPTLTGDGESNSPGTGHGTVSFNAATDSLSVSLTFAGVTSPTAVPAGVPGASQIHFGGPGVAGPILFPFLNFPTGVTSGMYKAILTAADLTPDPAYGINTFGDALNAIEG